MIAVAAAGRQARRRDGKLPPHVMVCFAMAMALFADEDYEEVAAQLAGTLAAWGCWDAAWSIPSFRVESWHFRGHFHYAAFGAGLSNWRS